MGIENRKMITYDQDNKLLYISLKSQEDEFEGIATHSIELDNDVMAEVVTDTGEIIGIEILNREKVEYMVGSIQEFLA
jgi:uncharacterized protein YuzE|tara:strand:- start:8439 stop:8672 length:234 start_codon:yes stop_codon:yes gene_type:complete